MIKMIIIPMFNIISTLTNNNNSNKTTTTYSYNYDANVVENKNEVIFIIII